MDDDLAKKAGGSRIRKHAELSSDSVVLIQETDSQKFSG